MEEPAHTTIPDKDAPWTDTETLLLLEGLENFDTNWDEVASHVGTRTREECVMKFLQIDIQDQYMEDGAGSIEHRALGGREPISHAETPVMSVVSFLAQMHDPSVVAAASQRSIEQMHKDLRKELEKGMSSQAAETTKNGEHVQGQKEGDVKAEDSMDVDTASKPSHGSSQDQLSDLSTTALAVSAARSAALATHEEREATRLVSAATNLTLKKYELKLAQFAEMEEVVQAERRDLEKGRQQLFLDQLRFRKRVRDMENQLKQMSIGGGSGQESMRVLAETMREGMMGAGFGFANGNSSGVAPISADGDVASADI